MIDLSVPEKCFVTLMAVDVVGSTEHVRNCDPDEIQLFQDLLFERIQAFVSECLGHIISFAGDGGIAVFGWPNSVQHHADYALFSAKQILDICTGPRPLIGPDGNKVQCRIGVHSGLVGMRQITLANVSRTDTVGETVHLAATLQKAAEANQALVSSVTINLCNEEHDIEPSDPVANFDADGRSSYKLTSRPLTLNKLSRTVNYATAFIGRKKELDVLVKSLPKGDKTIRALCLVGEAGIGKTRLARELVGRATLNCAVTLVDNNGLPNAVPFQIVRKLIGRLAGQEQTGAANLRRRLVDEFKFSEEDAHMLMVGLGQSEKAPGPANETYSVRSMSLIMVKAILAFMGTAPHLLIVEDAHWIDPESLECMHTLIKEADASNFTLVITGRPEARERMERLADKIIELKPLNKSEMLRLAKDFHHEKADHLVEQAINKSEGVPFVLEQILLSLNSTHSEENGSIDLMPMSVESVIHSRLNRLGGDAKQLAQTLSVIGQETSRTVATKVTGHDYRNLVNLLDELEQHQFVYSDDDIIRFRHQILAEACLTTVSRQRTTEVHKKTIRAISATYTNLGPHYLSLAHHSREAGERENELDYLWQAALHARRSSAMLSLKSIMIRALDALATNPELMAKRHLDFVLVAGPALLQIGEFRLAREHFPRALSHAQFEKKDTLLCGALCQFASLCWFEGNFQEGLKHSEHAIKLARRTERLPLLFSSLMIESIHHWVMGNLDQAISTLKEICRSFGGSLEGVRMGATAMPSVMGRVFLGWSLLETGSLGEAGKLGAEALNISNELNDPYGQSLALNFLGLVAHIEGRYEDAVTILEEALSLCDQNGFDTSRTTIVGNLCASLALSGEMKRALTLAEGWLSADMSRMGVVERLYAMRGIAATFSANGNRRKAAAIIDDAVESARKVESPCFEARMLETRLWVQRSSSDRSTHQEDKKRLAQLYKSLGMKPLFVNPPKRLAS